MPVTVPTRRKQRSDKNSLFTSSKVGSWLALVFHQLRGEVASVSTAEAELAGSAEAGAAKRVGGTGCVDPGNEPVDG